MTLHHGIDWDEIHTGKLPMQKMRQLLCLCDAVIDILNEDILIGHTPLCLVTIRFPSSDDLCQGIFPIDGHETRPKFTFRCMKRNREVHRDSLVCKFIDARYDTRCRERYVPIAHTECIWFMDKSQETEHTIIIHQGLAGTHEYHRVHFLPLLRKEAFDEEHLRQDLSSREIACHTMQRRSAESTPHIASCLCGNTDAVAIRLTHQDRFHGRAILKREQELARFPIRRVECRFLPCRAKAKLRLKRRAQLLGQVRHLIERGCHLLIHPSSNLLRPIARHLQRKEHTRNLFHGQPKKVLFHCFLLFMRAIKNPSIPSTCG